MLDLIIFNWRGRQGMELQRFLQRHCHSASPPHSTFEPQIQTLQMIFNVDLNIKLELIERQSHELVTC